MENAPPSLDHSALRQRIWAHPFEHAEQSRDLVRRVAMEQGWPVRRARAALEEYRRFCFLAVVCPHAVTPSEEVDAVWHAHLLYTRDYWKVFCPEVLGRELHHGPTLGGAKEEARFYDQYAETLASYQHYFGPPPPEFWPPARVRFRPARHSRWVYLPDAWIIPRPRAIWRACLAFMKKDTP